MCSSLPRLSVVILCTSIPYLSIRNSFRYSALLRARDLSKAENYLSNHLFDGFPGIDFLAKKFNLSESKLKTEFKNLYGKPVFRYFQEKQMYLAKELIHENQMLIKEISYKFGYENTSKFSAAFKKHHGNLPSEV